MRTSLLCFLLLALAAVRADEPPRFRTDADGPVTANEKRVRPQDRKPGDKPAWFQLVAGQFPPEGSAHAIAGELIQADHLQRRFQLRVDRHDSQDRGVWDLPLEAGMLPYGSLWRHGAPAALQDVPLGAHLHGLFYVSDPGDQTPLPVTANQRRTPEWEFRRCFRLEDDFTHHARRNQLWRVESVDLEAKKLHAVLSENGRPVDAGKVQTFDLPGGVRVFQGGGFGELKSLAAGQMVLFNLTWVTLYGPGRITEIWLDEESRARATAHQGEVHRNHIRERGLAGWVTAVDDQQEIVTVAFFGGVDPQLLGELTGSDSSDNPPGGGGAPPSAATGRLAVAHESLLTYDPVNDAKRGTVLEVRKIPVEPGGSGVQVKLKMDLLLEGYRPKCVVRFFPAAWKVIALPKEEQLHGRE